MGISDIGNIFDNSSKWSTPSSGMPLSKCHDSTQNGLESPRPTKCLKADTTYTPLKFNLKKQNETHGNYVSRKEEIPFGKPSFTALLNFTKSSS